MKAIVVLTVVICTARSYGIEHFSAKDKVESIEHFRQWAIKHAKVYSNQDEFSTRYAVFLENMKTAAKLNDQRQDVHSAIFGDSKFADRTDQEFVNMVLGPSMSVGDDTSQISRRSFEKPAEPAQPGSTPGRFDWSDRKGVVTPVRDQGNKYRTGWAFAGVASLESQYAIKTGKQSESLSTEAIVDCDGFANPVSMSVACGVSGANMMGFLDWVSRQDGLIADKDYPYCVGDESCRPCAPPKYNADLCNATWPISPCRKEDSCEAKYNSSKFIPGVKVGGYEHLVRTPEKSVLRAALIRDGPMAAGIDAIDLKLYKSGVLKPVQCTKTNLNHHVLIVGYGNSTQSGEWRIKNSWGTEWGEQGFFRLQMGVEACGINRDLAIGFLEMN